VGAPIVESEHVPVRVHEQDRAMLAVHNEPPLGFQLLEGASTHEVWTLRLHVVLVQQAPIVAYARPA
jgi:hypothetical protein